MPRFKPVRAKRYEKLRNNGFLPFEAYVLSKVPSKVPYIKDMVKDRKSVLRKAKSENLSYKNYRKHIADIYAQAGWSQYGTMGKTKLMKLDRSAVYRMLRHYQDIWENEHGRFSSPWIKRQKQYDQFTRKYEKTYQFYD